MADLVPWSTLPNGSVVAVSNTETGAVATGTTVIPADDTIPQNTEGDQYMTLSHTPLSSTNKLKVEVVMILSSSIVNAVLTAALFQDNIANALAVAIQQQPSATWMNTVTLTYYMTAGTTSPITFKARAGAHSAGTTTFNGAAGARYYGGVLASSITVTEIKG